MFLASENIDFTGLSHVFLLGGGEKKSFFRVYERRRIAAAVLCPAAAELRVALCAVVKQRGSEAEIARDVAERICTDIDFHVNFPNRNKFTKNKLTYQVKSYHIHK